MERPQPVFLADLLGQIDQELQMLLTSLSGEDWARPTIAGNWSVKDVAVHLLDGNLRTLSMLRDGYYGEDPGEIGSYQDLVAYLNRLNADWVKAMRRLSPQVITELLAISGTQYVAYLRGLDPFVPAVFSVAWAGEERSANWFHIAREYTEKWHHQQQIRLAVGREEILYQPKYYGPYLDVSMRALPHHYRNAEGCAGETICFTIEGEAGGTWSLKLQEKGWELYLGRSADPVCEVQLPEGLAWRIFTKGISKHKALQQSHISGRAELGLRFFDMLAVMA